MFAKFLTISIRNLKRSRVFTVLNILGLTIALSAAILIGLFVLNELSYDRFHEHADRIYRLTLSFKNGNSFTTTTTSPYIISGLIDQDIPDIESQLRLYYAFNTQMESSYKNRYINITDRFTYSDPNLFTFFSFNLLKGDPNSALEEPNAVVITQTEASRLFKSEDPMGKIISITGVYEQEDFKVKVTGIMEDIPVNSHIPYDYYISMETLTNMAPSIREHWGWTSQNTYLKLKPGMDIKSVENKLTEIVQTYAPEWFQNWARFGIQPMLDIHLYSDLKEEIKPGGDATYVNMLKFIAVFIVIIAAINYMNLSTSLASSRMKEIGIKKIVGASRQHLSLQFLLESFIVLVVSLVISLTIVQLTLPWFNNLTGRELSILNLPWSYYGFGLLMLLLLGLLSGSYPSIFLSSFKIVSALSGDRYQLSRNTNRFRQSLVVLQFVISSFLICGTLVILNQWQYLRKKSLGINTEETISISLPSKKSQDHYSILRTALSQDPSIKDIGTCSKSITGRFDGFDSFQFDGIDLSLPVEYADAGFFETFSVQLVDGRLFTQNPADSNAIILNQKAADQLNLKNPVGKTVKMHEDEMKIVGVVQNFHFEPLYTELGPVVFLRSHKGASFVYLNLQTENLSQTLSRISDVWTSINPELPLDYKFVDQQIDHAYKNEQTFLRVFVLFSLLAIFIACLGLFGLVNYGVSLRIKEIGIRKVLGANLQSIMSLLSKGFIKLIILANVIAWPIIYLTMSHWLEKFPYRIDVGFGVLIIGTFFTILIALIVISSQSLKVGMLNPVDSLRSE